MYGLVNHGIEHLVTATRGEAAWARICARAGCEWGGFIAMQSYPEATTDALMRAVGEELDMSRGEVLEAFGEHWIRHSAETGYGAVLGGAGGSLRRALGNLDDLQGRLETMFRHMKLPQFEVEDIGPGEYRLHYGCDRDGLAPMVVGLLRGLAGRCDQPVEITHEVARGPHAPRDVFRVRELPGQGRPAS